MIPEDELKRRKELDRAAKAKVILENPLFEEAFVAVREGYIKKWHASRPEQAELRELLWWSVRALDDVALALKSAIITGDMAQKQLAEMVEGRAQTRRRRA